MAGKRIRFESVVVVAVALLASSPVRTADVDTGAVTGTAFVAALPEGPVAADFFFQIGGGFSPAALAEAAVTLPSPVAPASEVTDSGDPTLPLAGPRSTGIASAGAPGARSFMELLANLIAGLESQGTPSSIAEASSDGLFSFAIVAATVRTDGVIR